MKKKLSPAQERLMAELRAGQTIVRSFDVYGGWWYWLRPTQTKLRESTVLSLVDRGIITIEPEKRIYSGYREATYRIAKAAP